MKLITRLRQSPIAINTAEANQQHYELPPEFFERVLGKHLKYSSCYYRQPGESLEQAEAAMLALTAERARLKDGDRILELGCGWGSLSLWMAERFPGSRITAVSNSRPQKAFIDERARQRGLSNLEVITLRRQSSGAFRPTAASIAWSRSKCSSTCATTKPLMRRIASWLRAAGDAVRAHLHAQGRIAYPFEVRDESDWMAKYFFTGGIMPSDDLLLYFQNDLKIEEHWQVDGTHYGRTAEHWLENMDRNRREIEPVLAATYGPAELRRWWVYWRVFFMSCAELWNYAGGREWLVSHYLFKKP